MLTLTKTFHFAASHTLHNPNWSQEKNEQIFQKCARLHGHNYVLEVTVCGPINPDTGMVMNATELSAVVKESIIDELDHRDLNSDIVWLEGKITTAENLNEAIWNRLAPMFAQRSDDVSLYELKLWETPKMCVSRRAG
ncbi:MAG: 6-carboxytetrahydropterin synthase [Bdellovibrionales bacterium]|nr:6-carboxytetrahydropterin synthase [Bdellovibrionales bacterium]